MKHLANRVESSKNIIVAAKKQSLAPPNKKFSIDARAILSLGRDSIKDHVTAVVELVKNSYDAGATIAQIELNVGDEDEPCNFIRITDDGHGMNERDVETKWLRIGFSEKLVSKTIGSRRRLGEKGVGRLSADRLGACLHLRSQARNETPIGIEVDWSKFEKPGIDLQTVEIKPLHQATFFIPQPNKVLKGKAIPSSWPKPIASSKNVTGCELLITALRQQWLSEDIRRLRDELSHLINPFDSSGGFQVRILNNIDPELTGLIEPPEVANGQIEGVFSFSGNSVTIKVQTADELRRKIAPRTEKMSLSSFRNLSSKDEKSERSVGNIKIHLRLYSVNKEELDSSHTKNKIQNFLESNAGVRVYRDGVRVLPYGDPKRVEGDWLGLGKRKAEGRAGISRDDWRIESNRVVGAVSIGRDDNPQLLDAASREGLVSNDAFVVLRKIVLASVRHLERKYQAYRKDKIQKEDVVRGKIQPQKVVRAFNARIKELGATLQTLEKALPKAESEKVARIRKEIVQQERKFQQLRQGLSDYLDQALTFRGLATLGIAHASFGHEIQISAGQFIGTVKAAQLVLNRTPADIPKAQNELNKAIDHGKRISTWGSYTLTRVNATKRVISESADVKLAVQRLVNDLQPFFKASSIALECGKLSDITATFVPMDIESLAINFLTNAYDFVKESKGVRKVRVDIESSRKDGKVGFWLKVADSGKGVPEHMRDDIWSPLFTTKEDENQRPYGTGLGLSIVDAIVQDLGGERQVGTDPELGGALFSVWIPLNE